MRELARETLTLRTIYDEHEGVRDRFVGAGTVTPELAARLGLIGLAGRASGQASICAPTCRANPTRLGAGEDRRYAGDVAARVAVRFDELQESCRLILEIIEALPPGRILRPWRCQPTGLGSRIDRGLARPVLVALEAGRGTIRRCHPHDPSWQNWPVLEHAIIDNIVPDFPCQ